MGETAASGIGSPLLSIVIPVYQTYPEYFDECLESLSQIKISPADLEVIVVFDGEPSTELFNVLGRWKRDLTIRDIHMAPHGVSAARNRGMTEVRGKWTMFVDSDDRVISQALPELIRFAENERADLVMGAHVSVSSSMKEEHWYAPNSISCSEAFSRTLRMDVLNPAKASGLVWGKIYRSEFLHSRKVRFDESLEVAEDSDFLFRLLHDPARAGYFHSEVYLYRRNEKSAVTAFREDYADRIGQSLEKMRINIFAEENPELRAGFDSYVLFHLLLIMVHYLFNPNAPWTRSERRAKYKEVLSQGLYSRVLHEGDTSEFPLTRRISIFSLRHRIYPMSFAISVVRQHQIR